MNFKIKRKTLQDSFTIQYCPGKWHKAAGAVSRNPPKVCQPSIFSVIELCSPPPLESLYKEGKIKVTNDMVFAVSLATINSTFPETPPSNKLITIESLNNASKADPEYQQLPLQWNPPWCGEGAYLSKRFSPSASTSRARWSNTAMFDMD